MVHPQWCDSRLVTRLRALSGSILLKFSSFLTTSVNLSLIHIATVTLFYRLKLHIYATTLL